MVQPLVRILNSTRSSSTKTWQNWPVSEKSLVAFFFKNCLWSECTVLVLMMAHRIWKETKLQPGTAGPGNMLGSCLFSFHFLWTILSTSTVPYVFESRAGGSNEAGFTQPPKDNFAPQRRFSSDFKSRPLSLSLPPSVSLPVCLSHDTGLPAACSALSFAVINEERWLRSFEIPINLSILPSIPSVPGRRRRRRRFP